MNIKSLPTQYVLKRWTREARSETIQDSHGRDIIENPRLYEMLRYKNMTHKFLNLAHRATSHPECSLLVHNTLDVLSKQVEEEIIGCTNNVEVVTVPMNITPSSDLVSATRLKQKEVQTKTSKRKRTWLDKKLKFTKKGSKKKDKSSTVCISKKTSIFYYKNVQLYIIFYSILLKDTRDYRIGTRNYSSSGYSS
jgi:zinc finger SWIM domain-containing protein 3